MNMENQVIQNILERRSIRSYKPDQITDEQRDLILKAATYAPSGSNNQSWLFTVIQNQVVIDQLNDVVKEAFRHMEVAENEYPAKVAAKRNSTHPQYHFCYHAPTLVIASNVPGYANAMADCSCALENMFLAAHSLGLGTCWINQLRWLNESSILRDFLETLGLSKEQVICGATTIGYPDGPTPKAGKRKENTIHIIR